MKKFEIEIINVGSEIIEVEAETLQEAREKALQQTKDNPENYFNFDGDCNRVLLKETHKQLSDSVFKTEFIFISH